MLSPARPHASRRFPGACLSGLAWGFLLATLVLRGAAAADAALGLMAQQAAQSYAQGRYAEAADLYLRFIATGGDGAQARYDLGNCYLKSGRLGQAIVEYRRALRDDPHLEPAAHNLEVARRLLPARVAPWQPPPWETTLRALPARWLDWAVILPAILGNMALALVLLLPAGALRRACAGVLIGAFVCAGAALSCWAYARTVLPSHQSAVVLEPASVYASPDQTGKPLAILPPGSEVVCVARAGQWSLLLWGEGRGWTSSAEVETP